MKDQINTTTYELEELLKGEEFYLSVRKQACRDIDSCLQLIYQGDSKFEEQARRKKLWLPDLRKAQAMLILIEAHINRTELKKKVEA